MKPCSPGKTLSRPLGNKCHLKSRKHTDHYKEGRFSPVKTDPSMVVEHPPKDDNWSRVQVTPAHNSPLGNADQCMVGHSPYDTSQLRVQGPAEHNSVKEYRTGNLTLNSKGDTTARNRPHLKAGRVGPNKTSIGDPGDDTASHSYQVILNDKMEQIDGEYYLHVALQF